MASRSMILLATTLLVGCSGGNGSTDVAISDQQVELRPDSDVDGPPADALIDAGDDGIAPIRLPKDEKPHEDPVEWWYYTGLLQAENGD